VTGIFAAHARKHSVSKMSEKSIDECKYSASYLTHFWLRMRSIGWIMQIPFVMRFLKYML